MVVVWSRKRGKGFEKGKVVEKWNGAYEWNKSVIKPESDERVGKGQVGKWNGKREKWTREQGEIDGKNHTNSESKIVGKLEHEKLVQSAQEHARSQRLRVQYEKCVWKGILAQEPRARDWGQVQMRKEFVKPNWHLASLRVKICGLRDLRESFAQKGSPKVLSDASGGLASTKSLKNASGRKP
ncbi:hypothetical protein B0H11DRAFT_1913848 [Mycena galericulata]|nr:hypothetical protein B0H11DRAFT_1913848 [Mycena galericulata]